MLIAEASRRYYRHALELKKFAEIRGIAAGGPGEACYYGLKIPKKRTSQIEKSSTL